MVILILILIPYKMDQLFGTVYNNNNNNNNKNNILRSLIEKSSYI